MSARRTRRSFGVKKRPLSDVVSLRFFVRTADLQRSHQDENISRHANTRERLHGMAAQAFRSVAPARQTATPVKSRFSDTSLPTGDLLPSLLQDNLLTKLHGFSGKACP